jgi:hypothetical protein
LYNMGTLHSHNTIVFVYYTTQSSAFMNSSSVKASNREASM